MEVLSPPLPFDACAFGGDERGNSECGVHRKVITLNELLSPPAGCNCFPGWGADKDMVQLCIFLISMIKMGVVAVGLKPCRGRCEIMRGKFLGDRIGLGVAVHVCTEEAGDFVVGVRR
eukprot:15353225-Ditylum_brightwellii.AAC.1